MPDIEVKISKYLIVPRAAGMQLACCLRCHSCLAGLVGGRGISGGVPDWFTARVARIRVSRVLSCHIPKADLNPRVDVLILLPDGESLLLNLIKEPDQAGEKTLLLTGRDQPAPLKHDSMSHGTNNIIGRQPCIINPVTVTGEADERLPRLSSLIPQVHLRSLSFCWPP